MSAAPAVTSPFATLWPEDTTMRLVSGLFLVTTVSRESNKGVTSPPSVWPQRERKQNVEKHVTNKTLYWLIVMF